MLAWHDTPWMWLSMVLFWSLFAAFVYYAIRHRAGPGIAEDGPSAIEILERRYARGEMPASEYRERREALEATGARQGDG